MIWNLKDMSLTWKIIAVVGSLLACAGLLAGSFKLLKMIGIL